MLEEFSFHILWFKNLFKNVTKVTFTFDFKFKLFYTKEHNTKIQFKKTEAFIKTYNPKFLPLMYNH